MNRRHHLAFWLPALAAGVVTFFFPHVWREADGAAVQDQLASAMLVLVALLAALAGWMAPREGRLGRWAPALAGLTVPFMMCVVLPGLLLSALAIAGTSPHRLTDA